MDFRCTRPEDHGDIAEGPTNRQLGLRAVLGEKFIEAFLVRPRCRQLDALEPGGRTVVCPGCFFQEAKSGGGATLGDKRPCWTFDAEPDPPKERRRPRAGWEEGLHIEVDLVAFGLLVERLGCARYQVDLTPRISGPDPQLEYLVLAYLAEVTCGNPSGRAFLDTLSVAMTARLLAAYSTVRARRAGGVAGLPADQRRRVIDFIETHLEEACPLEKLAHEVGLGVFRFIRAFKASLGVTPHQFLLAKRIEKAKQLLKETHDPITEIAFATGFNGSSQLANVFQSRVGMSPREFRRNLGNFGDAG